MQNAILLTVLVFFASQAYADQGSFKNSGGSTSPASPSITSNVASPAGILSMNCPGANPTSCSGGSLTFASTDGSTSITATFTGGSFIVRCAGGGKGGHISCGASFTGYFSGTLTVNGSTQSINGVTYQAWGTVPSETAATGTTAYNSAYSPFYYSDSEQILRSDDLQGTNQISCCTQGLYGANAIALDSAGRIYVADTYNCRVVRFDDMTGKNWTTYGGACGSGQGQFYDPQGIAVDSAGRIYIMDTGNSRFVRIDDMTGSNWITYGAIGSGVGQFASFLSVAIDSAGRIYIADTGNIRIVRIDDMYGTNWTTLTGFTSPAAVAFDSAGRIYVADDGPPAGAVIRVDDMTGANRTLIYLGPVGTAGPNSISVDQSGTVFVGGGIGGAVKVVDDMAGVLNSSGAIGPVGPSYVFGVVAIPHPNPLPPALKPLPASLSFVNQNVGTQSAPQSVAITNFGGSPLEFSSVQPSAGFVADTSACPAALIAGTSCTILVSFKPVVNGPANGSLTLTDNSGNLGSQQSIALSGVGTSPTVSVTPGALAFPPQIVNTASAAQPVVVLNTGTGPLQVNTIQATAPFSETDNCAAPFAPGAACTILVTFTPTPTSLATGTLTITDNAGTQTVNLSGSVATAAPVLTVSPANLGFPSQLLKTWSAGQIVTITNTGAATVLNKGISITGDFAEITNCGFWLTAGKNCAVLVAFMPTATGPRTGALTINFGGTTQTVSLAGTGSNGSLPGALSLSPSSLSFTGYVIGDHPTQPVTVTNTSGAPVGIQGIAMHGGLWLSQTNNCPKVLAGGGSCTITVQFSPFTNGTFNSTLALTESSGAQDTVSVAAQSAPGN